jgi:hypothetical protein
MRKARQDTIEALEARKSPEINWRDLAIQLGMRGSHSTLNKLVLNGTIGEKMEIRLRHALKLPPIRHKTIESCPSCDEFHELSDCQNRKGELKIVEPRKSRKNMVSMRAIDEWGLDAYSPSLLAFAIRNRQEVQQNGD